MSASGNPRKGRVCVVAGGAGPRQGSLHASVRVIVLGAANTIEDDDAEKLERFQAIAERSAPSAGSSGA